MRMRSAVSVLLALPLSSCTGNTPTPPPTLAPRVETRLLAKIDKQSSFASQVAFEISNPTRQVFSERVSVALIRSSVGANDPQSPSEEVRAPIDPRTGTRAMDQSLLHLKPGESIRATVDLFDLRWDWPDGRYDLRLEVQAFSGPEPRQTRSQVLPVNIGKPPARLVGRLDATKGISRVRLRIENVSDAEFVQDGGVLFWLRPVPKSGQIRPDLERRTLAFSERDDLWAPLDPTSGRSYEVNTWPTFRLRSGEAIEKTVNLGSLIWSRVISPIWAHEPLDAVAAPGRYRLWLSIGHSAEWNMDLAEGWESGCRTDAVTVEVRALTGARRRQTASSGVAVENRRPSLVAHLDATSGASRVRLRIENASGADFSEKAYVHFWLRPVLLSSQSRLNLERLSIAYPVEHDLWAPLDPATGRSYGAAPPTVRLRSGEAIEKTVDLGSLRWGKQTDSIFGPTHPLDALAAPGQYRLWLDIWGHRTDTVTIDWRRW
jgi:hypothetical protein